MKATEEFFAQLEQEINDGVLEAPHQADENLPTLPIVEGTSSCDFTALRQMLGDYQTQLNNCNSLIISQQKAIDELTREVEMHEETRNRILELKEREFAMRLQSLNDSVSSYQSEVGNLTKDKAAIEAQLKEKTKKLVALSDSLNEYVKAAKVARKDLGNKTKENDKLRQQVDELRKNQSSTNSDVEGIQKAAYLKFLTELIAEAMGKEKESLLPIRELLFSFVSGKDWVPSAYIDQIKDIKDKAEKDQIKKVIEALTKSAEKGGIHIGQFNMGNGTQGQLLSNNNQPQLPE